jgi:hypothetical protein
MNPYFEFSCSFFCIRGHFDQSVQNIVPSLPNRTYRRLTGANANNTANRPITPYTFGFIPENGNGIVVMQGTVDVFHGRGAENDGIEEQWSC